MRISADYIISLTYEGHMQKLLRVGRIGSNRKKLAMLRIVYV